MAWRAWLLFCLAGCGAPVDADGDGALSDVDCDDADPLRFPGASEACDDRDADCDRLADDMDPDAPRTAWYADLDGDGFGRATAPREACVAPEAHVANADDCDDAHRAIYPGATELCDAFDGDCDGLADDVDPDLAHPTWYRDLDADGFGDAADALAACAVPAGYTAEAGDCADDDDAVNPAAVDACGGDDADCDGADDACARAGEASVADADAVLVGEAAGDGAGTRLAVGDTDGDGVADVLTIAPRAEGVAGAAWLVRGPLSGSRSLAEAALRIAGTRGDAAIGGVALGDLDGDGLAEVAVATPLAGTVWLFGAGRAGAVSLDDADGAWTGEVNTGASLAIGPDLDGDARADLVIGAPTTGGAGGVALGAGLGGDLSDATWLSGEAEGALAGFAVASPGDLDGDGVADLLVGAPGGAGAGDSALLEVGVAYVLYGPLAAGSLADADARLYGTSAGDRAGGAVAGVGDIDGDGLPDVMVGGPGRDAEDAAGDLAEDVGGAWLVRGPPRGDTALADAHCTLFGDAEGQGAGTTIAALGDLDGDGREDAAVGGDGAGRAWVLLGPFAGTIALTYAEVTVVGADAYDDAGAGLAGGGDVDGDGAPDLLVGSPGADAGGSGAGSVSMLRGWTP